MKQEYIMLAVSLLLFIFLVWKEWKRSSRAHLAIRLAASALAVAALACMIIPVTYSVTEKTGALNETVLLTPGSPKELPAALQTAEKITTDPALASSTIEYVPDLSVYLSEHTDIASLQIAGYGIDDHEWQLLAAKKINVSYLTPGLPAGFVKASWPQVIRQGDKLNVYGSYHNPAKDSVKIVLTGLGLRMDSTVIADDTTGTFQLHCLPAHSGATVYELEASIDGRTLSEEKVPVNILPAARTKVLFLSSSPDFENRFLTSWLYRNNYPAAIRNTVSQGKYDQQFLNLPSMVLQQITPSLLEKFDVLIADDKALSELNTSEAAMVKTQLNKGMGLIVQTDSAASLSSFSRPFGVKKQAVQPAAARSLLLPGTVARTKPLPAEQWFSILDDAYAQPLVTDEGQAVIVSSRLYGAGRVVLNTAVYTYSWILSGNEENYSAFWSLLINKAARQNQQESRWQQTSAFPTVDKPTGLVLETASSRPPIIKTSTGELYTTQTPYLPDTWTATWWPATPGWQTLSFTDTVSMYVFEKGDWPSARASELTGRNALHAAQQRSTLSQQDSIQQQARRVPVFIFFLVFLAACSYLWWEGKQHTGSVKQL